MSSTIKNYKTLKKQTEEVTINVKKSHGLAEYIVKIAMPKTTYACYTMPVKASMSFFAKIEKRILKHIWKNERH
jgi:hypothetical protein